MARPPRSPSRRASGLSAATAVAGLVLAGCADDEAGDDEASPTSTMSVPEGIERGDQPETTAPATTAPPPDVPDQVVLSAESVADLPIGSTPQVDVMAALVPVLGEPAMDDAECPGGSDTALHWEAGPTLLFADGQLSGWSYAVEEDPTLVI